MWLLENIPQWPFKWIFGYVNHTSMQKRDTYFRSYQSLTRNLLKMHNQIWDLQCYLIRQTYEKYLETGLPQDVATQRPSVFTNFGLMAHFLILGWWLPPTSHLKISPSFENPEGEYSLVDWEESPPKLWVLRLKYYLELTKWRRVDVVVRKWERLHENDRNKRQNWKEQGKETQWWGGRLTWEVSSSDSSQLHSSSTW